MKMLIFALLVLTAQAEINTHALLDVIAAKETGTGWDGRPGLCGELSRWQITEGVWRDRMGGEPFENARIVHRAQICALRHIAWLRRYTGDNVERLATCWHYGHTHRNRPSAWGQEVANLYESLEQ